MKIKEFIEKVNEHDGMKAKKIDELIVISTPNNMGMFSISEDVTDLFEIDTWTMSNGRYWKKADREYLSSLIKELLHTPVEERFPEKKYRLVAMRYVEGPVAIEQYVTGVDAGSHYANFNFGTKENAKEWTDANLHYLSQFFTKEVIEAMKEPVEDD